MNLNDAISQTLMTITLATVKIYKTRYRKG